MDQLIQFFSLDRIIATAIVIGVTSFIQLSSKRVVTAFVRHSIRRAKFKNKREEVLREDTLISIIYTTARVLIWLISLLLILDIFKINIAPILAGAGVAGVALGFGAQSMVKDFLAGVFILAENQYRVGDVLQVNQDVSGTVEALSLRMTTLRDIEGRVHYVPNGTIQIATNLTMDYATAKVDLTVDYKTDIDKLEKIINDVGRGIQDDPAWHDLTHEAPYMLRVDQINETGVVVRVVCKTHPAEQWKVKGEILRRLAKALDEAHIKMARALPMNQDVTSK